MIYIQIIGIRKPTGAIYDHSAISHYEWRDANGKTGIAERRAMVNWLLEDVLQRKAYVRDAQGDVAYCKIMENQYGTRYLETYADSTPKDNLLNLPRI